MSATLLGKDMAMKTKTLDSMVQWMNLPPLICLLKAGLVILCTFALLFISVKKIGGSSFGLTSAPLVAVNDKCDVSRAKLDAVLDVLSEIRQQSQSTHLKDPLEKQVTLYVITPTYPRLTQIPDMTRLGQTLKLTKNVKWLVGDDAKERSKAVMNLLIDMQIPFEYFLAPMPEIYSKKSKGQKPRGVAQRNAGLNWVREHGNDNGVLYFADDDNSYDARLFPEIRKTRRVSAFPVGAISNDYVSTPIVKNGSITGYYDGWMGGRKFPMDMAGFAVKVKFFKSMAGNNTEMMPFKVGYEEDGFLKNLKIDPLELEPLADNCTKVYVWHTQTKGKNWPKKPIDKQKQNGTNLKVIQDFFDGAH